jgi:hypothetical protein
MTFSFLTIAIGLLWLLNGTFWGLGLLLLSEIWAARLPEDSLTSFPGLMDSRQRIAVLIPAHNEAAEIAATIQSILPQMKGGDRLIAIADNCSDRDGSTVTSMILTQVPRLFGVAFSQGRLDLMVLALDLSIPPLSLFVLLWVGLVLLNLGLFAAGISSSVSL